MPIDKDQAATMYARACCAWYGKRARRVVTTKIAERARVGDSDGVKVWSEIAAKLSLMKRNGSSTAGGNGRLY